MVALSSCEVEYIVGSFAACQAKCLNSLLKEIKFEVKKLMQLLVDNKSTINLTKNPISHGRNKHKKPNFHFLREKVATACYPTELQIADMLTKAMKAGRFEMLKKELGVVHL